MAYTLSLRLFALTCFCIGLVVPFLGWATMCPFGVYLWFQARKRDRERERAVAALERIADGVDD